MGRESEQTFFQRRHTNDQQVHEKVLNITNHKGNANQNYEEISPHAGQNGYHLKKKRQGWQARVWREGNPPALLVGM